MHSGVLAPVNGFRVGGELQLCPHWTKACRSVCLSLFKHLLSPPAGTQKYPNILHWEGTFLSITIWHHQILQHSLFESLDFGTYSNACYRVYLILASRSAAYMRLTSVPGREHEVTFWRLHRLNRNKWRSIEQKPLRILWINTHYIT